MANWFIGLPVRHGAWFDRLLANAPDDVKRFHGEDLHATIAFLGACGEERARAAWATLEGWSCASIHATLGRVEPFGNPRRPSALSLTLCAGGEHVVAVIALLRGRMYEAASAPVDRRDPVPHITIARPSRRGSAAQHRRALEWAAALPSLGEPVELDRIALYTWSEDRRSRQFRIVSDRKLA